MVDWAEFFRIVTLCSPVGGVRFRGPNAYRHAVEAADSRVDVLAGTHRMAPLPQGDGASIEAREWAGQE